MTTMPEYKYKKFRPTLKQLFELNNFLDDVISKLKYPSKQREEENNSPFKELGESFGIENPGNHREPIPPRPITYLEQIEPMNYKDRIAC